MTTHERVEAQRLARAWLASLRGGSDSRGNGLVQVSHHAPQANVFLDAEIDGQRYQACIVGSSLAIRTRRAFNGTRHIVCRIGASVIDRGGAGEQDVDGLWYLDGRDGQKLVLHLSDAGRRTFALTFGIPIMPLAEDTTLSALCPADYFYASNAFDALRVWALVHPRIVSARLADDLLGRWGEAAHTAQSLCTRSGAA